MTIVYNTGQYDVSWSSPREDDDKERTYRGHTLKRDRFNPRMWIVDYIRFTSFQKAVEYLDKEYPDVPQHDTTPTTPAKSEVASSW